MNDYEKRMAIAEACGWWVNKPLSIWQHKTKGGAPPDYPNSLDAMHEAEKVLNAEDKCAAYASELSFIVHGFPCDPYRGPQSYIWHATAAQRADALLATIKQGAKP